MAVQTRRAKGICTAGAAPLLYGCTCAPAPSTVEEVAEVAVAVVVPPAPPLRLWELFCSTCAPPVLPRADRAVLLVLAAPPAAPLAAALRLLDFFFGLSAAAHMRLLSFAQSYSAAKHPATSHFMRMYGAESISLSTGNQTGSNDTQMTGMKEWDGTRVRGAMDRARAEEEIDSQRDGGAKGTEEDEAATPLGQIRCMHPSEVGQCGESTHI